MVPNWICKFSQLTSFLANWFNIFSHLFFVICTYIISVTLSIGYVVCVCAYCTVTNINYVLNLLKTVLYEIKHSCFSVVFYEFNLQSGIYFWKTRMIQIYIIEWSEQYALAYGINILKKNTMKFPNNHCYFTPMYNSIYRMVITAMHKGKNKVNACHTYPSTVRDPL